eukprot:CAMPEP_0179891520 /NCGR_PEP_ID=MMETSP0982-20121206/33728_1 /TAXON_ID=483367 /ORGANISM="non described non described, Strain CCMP 2436" /LENGTH=101 /DNA_ID=CAMNT_0021787913 /DNA_START=187 /DNA_END=488 /DNA_ORIENTATION=+
MYKQRGAVGVEAAAVTRPSRATLTGRPRDKRRASLGELGGGLGRGRLGERVAKGAGDGDGGADNRERRHGVAEDDHGRRDDRDTLHRVADGVRDRVDLRER